MKDEALALAKSKAYHLRRTFGWGPLNRDFLSLTDRSVEREFWADHFYRLFQSGRGDEAEAGVTLLEVHGEEAYEEYLEETNRLAAEADARERRDTVPLEDGRT